MEVFNLLKGLWYKIIITGRMLYSGVEIMYVKSMIVHEISSEFGWFKCRGYRPQMCKNAGPLPMALNYRTSTWEICDCWQHLFFSFPCKRKTKTFLLFALFVDVWTEHFSGSFVKFWFCFAFEPAKKIPISTLYLPFWKWSISHNFRNWKIIYQDLNCTFIFQMEHPIHVFVFFPCFWSPHWAH